jgi:hypothetical protein
VFVCVCVCVCVRFVCLRVCLSVYTQRSCMAIQMEIISAGKLHLRAMALNGGTCISHFKLVACACLTIATADQNPSVIRAYHGAHLRVDGHLHAVSWPCEK